MDLFIEVQNNSPIYSGSKQKAIWKWFKTMDLFNVVQNKRQI